MIEVEKLDLVPYPHPALRWKSKPVRKFDSLIKDVAQKMCELMELNHGIGLAANQIGLPWRIFVAGKTVFINPVITVKKNTRTLIDIEGCLSLPGLKLGIERPSRDVKIEAQDIEGKNFVITYAGLMARVVQHETDHLDGILIPDRAKMDERGVEELNKWLFYLKTQYDWIQNNLKQIPQDNEIIEQLVALEKLV